MRKWMLSVALALAVWIAASLVPDGQHSLRRFDGAAVGRIETRMWRSYYEHRPMRLFRELTGLLREQYRLPFWRSVKSGYHAARAAVVFQRGHDRAGYALALPDLQAFYQDIRRGGDVPFDAREAARLELEWWIVHRERDRHPPEALERSLAALQACLYRAPAEVFAQHAKARAEAMLLRDQRGSAITNDDWNAIGVLLDRSWIALAQAVERQARASLQ